MTGSTLLVLPSFLLSTFCWSGTVSALEVGVTAFKVTAVGKTAWEAASVDLGPAK